MASNYELGNNVDPVRNPTLPFDAFAAFTQGYIGYHLQSAIGRGLRDNQIRRSVVALVTQVAVDGADPAFSEPTKPIGLFFDKHEADKLRRLYGYAMREDSGRGFRRVIASPAPQDIIEKEVILDLCARGTIVVSCGGGGIPVVREKDGNYRGTFSVVQTYSLILSHFT